MAEATKYCNTPAQARTFYLGIGRESERRGKLEDAAEKAMQHFMSDLCSHIPTLQTYVGFKEAREELKKTLLKKAIQIFEGKKA